MVLSAWSPFRAGGEHLGLDRLGSFQTVGGLANFIGRPMGHRSASSASRGPRVLIGQPDSLRRRASCVQNYATNWLGRASACCWARHRSASSRPGGCDWQNCARKSAGTWWLARVSRRSASSTCRRRGACRSTSSRRRPAAGRCTGIGSVARSCCFPVVDRPERRPSLTGRG